MPKRIRPAKHYQRADNPVRALVLLHKPKVARDLRAALNHLGDIVPSSIAQLIRNGRWREIKDRIDFNHYREILKKPFARIADAYEAGAQHGVRKINGSFHQARRRVRFRKVHLHSSTFSDIEISKAAADVFNFDMFNANVQQTLRQAQDDLIQQLEQSARDAIETIVLGGAQDGLSASEIVDDIRSMIGLTDTQAQAVMNYRSMLESLDPNALDRQLRNTEFDAAVQDAIDNAENIASDAVDQMVQDYADNYLDYRASTIAQTESVRAINEGLHDSYSQAIDRGALPDSAVTREWELGDSPCPICESIPDNNPDGVGVDEDFESDDGPVSDPPIHPNCCPAGTLVSSGSGIAAVSTRWHNGQLAIIRTASGNEIPGTINHPVLTQRGWVGLGLLKHGDHVVRRTTSERLSGGMNYQNVPTLFENVACAASQSRQMTARKVPLSAEDFHGDVMNGDVAIVWTDIQLLMHSPRINRAIKQRLVETIFKYADPELFFKACARSLFAFGGRMLPITSGGVSFAHLAFPFGFGSFSTIEAT